MVVINVVRDGGINQFYRSLSCFLDNKGIQHFQYEGFLNTIRKLKFSKERKVTFTCNTKEVYLFVLFSYFFKFEINLILHDHKLRDGATIRERILIRLFHLFKNKFKNIIVHSSLSSFGIYKKMPFHGENIQRKALNILQFGRVEDYKNIDFLVELISRVKDVSLVIAGSGEINESTKRTIANSDNISIVNQFVDANLLNRLMESSDVLSLVYKDITQTGLVDFALNNKKILMLSNIPEFEEIEESIVIKHVDISDIEVATHQLRQLVNEFRENNTHFIDEFDNIILKPESEWSDYVDIIKGF
ncbi:hypothetical protein AB6C80_007680 [Vibrio cyclitrophicus]